MTHTPDLHDLVIEELEQRLASIDGLAPAVASGEQASSTAELDDDVDTIQTDLQTLRAHYAAWGHVRGAEGPELCPECREPKPCPVVREIADRYGVEAP